MHDQRTQLKSQIGLAAATLIVLAAAACGSEPTPAAAPAPQAPSAPVVATSPPSAKVTSDVENFVLEELVVAVGTEVSWTNRDTRNHTITSGSQGSSTGIWDSPLLTAGASYTFTFNEVGTFKYFCRIHPGSMNSTITVVPIEEPALAQASAAPSPTPKPPTATLEPPTATAVPPTATAVPPTQISPSPTPTAQPAATAVAMVEQTVTLTPIRDNTMYEPLIGVFGLNSNGRGSHIFVGSNKGGFARRALISFDAGEQIPAEAIIVDATLGLHVSKTIAPEQTIEVHRLLRNWGEGASDGSKVKETEGQGAPAQPGDATWIHRVFDTEMWEVPGGAFSDPASASASVADVGNYTWTSKQLTADVQMWVDDPSSNFGWIVIGDESINKTTKRFDSRENATAANRPRLQVTFAVPEGSTGSGGVEPSPTPYADLCYQPVSGPREGATPRPPCP